VRHLIEKGHPKEAAIFVPRCDSSGRVDLYVDCGDWRAAGKECKERGDKAKMEYVFGAPASSKPVDRFTSKVSPEKLSQFLDRKGA